MKLNEVYGKRYAVYYDYTGAGRGPEVIAGPFGSKEEAEQYAEDWQYPLTGDEYFVDVYKANDPHFN